MMGKRRRRSSSSYATSSSSYSTTSDAKTLFAIMLAALSNRQSQGTLVIQKAVNYLLHSLLSKSPNSILRSQKTLQTPLISLLPLLLNS
ncbi:hypothetical protein R6Q57_006170, partial [Mikania cordata]